MEDGLVASKGLGPLATIRGSALAHGCGRGGRVVLPLARAAAVSTGLRVLGLPLRLGAGVPPLLGRLLPRRRLLAALRLLGVSLVRVRWRVRVRVRVRVGLA